MAQEPQRLELRHIPGWADDQPAEALPALLRSCAAWAGMPPATPLGGADRGALPGDWMPGCAALRALGAQPAHRRGRHEWQGRVRATLEEHFLAADHGAGALTGYFEPTLRGRREPDEHHVTPLLAPPAQPRPLPPRAAIEAGALAGQGLELVWVDSEMDAFFLHIQGSGRVVLDDGTLLRLGYAAQNGHPYLAIGRLLIQRGEIAREAMSMQAIQAWMRRVAPNAALALMQANPSYIFFRPIPGLVPHEGPLGALGVPLTPLRSIAVDREHVPLGAPVFLVGAEPAPRLVAAQDVGGAIRGRARGDFFWGWSEEARERAGRMNQQTRMFVLTPRGETGQSPPVPPPAAAPDPSP